MTLGGAEKPAAPPASGDGSPDGIVLVAFGAEVDLRPLLDEAQRRLAELLLLHCRALPETDSPEIAMASLRGPLPAVEGEARKGWLSALPLDPGLFLPPMACCWAEVLGAWRQTTVALVTEPQLHTGLPAAGTALMRQWNVPLLGLIQWGGDWNEERRRSEGLPWLGLLHSGGKDLRSLEEEDLLRSSLLLRWRLVLGQEEKAVEAATPINGQP